MSKRAHSALRSLAFALAALLALGGATFADAPGSKEYEEKVISSSLLTGRTAAFTRAMAEKLLSGSDRNAVCSPLNAYLALAALAEVTDGRTRSQILDALGAPDVGSVREAVPVIWEANHVEADYLTSLLAVSLWLNEGLLYDPETIGTLRDVYHASAFAGDPSSAGMTQALRDWTNENTGGLLREYAEGMTLSPDTVLALVSTLYYKAAWIDAFDAACTAPGIFHAQQGDEEADMMRRTDFMLVTRTDLFTSVRLYLLDSGYMEFFLPAEGTDVSALASDPDVYASVSGQNGPSFSLATVDLTLPKFRVSSETDLTGLLRSLGVTDVLDPSLADYTPLTRDTDSVYLSSAQHAAVVEVDEEGVTGAAYTLLMNDALWMPDPEKIELVFDRPFLFLTVAADGSVLFAGIVRSVS